MSMCKRPLSKENIKESYKNSWRRSYSHKTTRKIKVNVVVYLCGQWSDEQKCSNENTDQKNIKMFEVQDLKCNTGKKLSTTLAKKK